MAAHDGYYVIVDEAALTMPQTHFGRNVGYVEFLDSILGENSHRTRLVECELFSTLMGLYIEAYEKDGKTVYFTEDMFSAAEANFFTQIYEQEFKTGTRITLAERKEKNIYAYVFGLIELLLTTESPENGVLEMNFASDGPAVLPFLLMARSFYTSPKAGNFRRVEIDIQKISISFYC